MPLWGAAPTLRRPARASRSASSTTGSTSRTRSSTPPGFTPPPGFPRGDRRFTTAKVIVARAFPPPSAADAGSSCRSTRRSRSTATHVAGIAAGDAGTTATPGGGLPVVHDLSGVAPRAYLGNYRGADGRRPAPRVGRRHGRDRRGGRQGGRQDGMDVHQPLARRHRGRAGARTRWCRPSRARSAPASWSRSRPATTTRSSARARSARPARRPTSITVAATSTPRFFGVRGGVLGPGAVPAELQASAPRRRCRRAVPAALASPARARRRPPRFRRTRACATGSRPAAGRRAGPGRPRRLRLRARSRAGRRPPAPSASCCATTRSGDPFVIEEPLPPAGALRRRGRRAMRCACSCRRPAGAAGGFDSAIDEVPATPRVLAEFSSAGPTPYTHELKPDLSAPGVAILSSVPSARPASLARSRSSTARRWRRRRWPAPRPCCARLHPTWTPADVKSALMSTAGPAFLDSSQAAEASAAARGRRLPRRRRRHRCRRLPAPTSLGFGLIDGGKGALLPPTVAVKRPRAAAAAGRSAVALQAGAPGGVTSTRPPFLDELAGGVVGLPVTLTVPAGTAEGDVTGFVTLDPGHAGPADAVLGAGRAPGARPRPARAPLTQAGGVRRQHAARAPTASTPTATRRTDSAAACRRATAGPSSSGASSVASRSSTPA